MSATKGGWPDTGLLCSQFYSVFQYLRRSSLHGRRLHRRRIALYDDLNICLLGRRSLRCRRLHRRRIALYNDLELCSILWRP